MSNYIDLVLVDTDTHDRFLCKAPWMSHLEKGTRVLFKTPHLTADGTVVATMDIGKDDEDLNFILECANERRLAKIVSKLKVIDFEYEDEDDE